MEQLVSLLQCDNTLADDMHIWNVLDKNVPTRHVDSKDQDQPVNPHSLNQGLHFHCLPTELLNTALQ